MQPIVSRRNISAHRYHTNHVARLLIINDRLNSVFRFRSYAMTLAQIVIWQKKKKNKLPFFFGIRLILWNCLTNLILTSVFWYTCPPSSSSSDAIINDASIGCILIGWRVVGTCSVSILLGDMAYILNCWISRWIENVIEFFFFHFFLNTLRGFAR